VEPNDNRKNAQHIEKLPLLVNGRLEKSGDVDSFALQLEAGQPLVASVDAYTLGSPIDPNLLLLDEQGNRVAFNSDSPQSCDPLLDWKAARAGTYILQVYAFAFPPAADVRFAGSAAAVYRLSIITDPYVPWMFPASIPSNCETEVELGTSAAKAKKVERFRSKPSSSTASFVTVPRSFGKLRLAMSDLPQQIEREPNNVATNVQSLHWPVAISGRIDPPGDEDRFVFDAKKGEKIEFRLRSAALGLPLDATLRIEDAGGKQVVRDDDSGDASDPLLNWTAPSNGTYRVVVADLLRRGGPEYVYALEVRAPVPDFKVSVDASAFRIEPGKMNEIKLAITRSAGYSNKLEVAVVGLPENVSFKGASITAKDKEGKISLLAATNARPFSGPFQIELADPANKLTRRVIFDLGPKESRFGEMLIGYIDQLWLTVATNSAAPEEKPKKK